MVVLIAEPPAAAGPSGDGLHCSQTHTDPHRAPSTRSCSTCSGPVGALGVTCHSADRHQPMVSGRASTVPGKFPGARVCLPSVNRSWGRRGAHLQASNSSRERPGSSPPPGWGLMGGSSDRPPLGHSLGTQPGLEGHWFSRELPTGPRGLPTAEGGTPRNQPRRAAPTHQGWEGPRGGGDWSQPTEGTQTQTEGS